MKNICGLLAVCSLLACPMSALGAEPDVDARSVVRIFAALEANDLKGYCALSQSDSYVVYITRVCQSAVQNKLKQPEDCSRENIAQQAKADMAQCLAMPSAEFEKKVRKGREGKDALFKALSARGIDGEKLLQEERRKAKE